MAISRSPLFQIAGATLLLLVAGILFFPASLFWNASIQHSAAPMDRCGTAPFFEGKDQSGHAIGNAELRGHVWLADFIKVADNQEGELLSSEFADLDQNFQSTEELALISFAIVRDTGIGPRDYANRHEASQRWHLLAAREEDSTALFAEWRTATKQCLGTLPLEKAFVLIDKEGVIRRAYDATAPEVVQKILIDVGSLLRDRTK
jgi:protein SCO1/2